MRIVLMLLLAMPAGAAETVFLVRHAEKLDASKDPPLSKTGEARAETLARDLADAGITAIFVTQYVRNQKTAEPLAKKLKLTPQVIPSGDVNTLVQKIKAERGRVLIVGHTDTLPKILQQLGAQPIALGDADYDNLLIVADGKLVRLHY